MSLQSVANSAKRALQQSAGIVALPKGSYAIAHVELYHWSRYYIVRVVSATREGKVKTFVDNPVTSAPRSVDRTVTIYSLPEQYKSAAEKLFAKQPLDFTGYADKEHLRLALVNCEIAQE